MCFYREWRVEHRESREIESIDSLKRREKKKENNRKNNRERRLKFNPNSKQFLQPKEFYFQNN
jgi:hypothetical protein